MDNGYCVLCMREGSFCSGFAVSNDSTTDTVSLVCLCGHKSTAHISEEQMKMKMEFKKWEIEMEFKKLEMEKELEKYRIDKSVAKQRKKYVLDLDGTLIFRHKGADESSYEVVVSTEDFYGDGFEGRPIIFRLNRRQIVVWFRRGVRKLLTLLSQNGIIYIATHACEVYAEAIAGYLRRAVPNILLKVTSFKKPILKCFSKPTNYEFILEDQHERWVPGTQNIRYIHPLTADTASTDTELIVFYMCLRYQHFGRFKKLSLDVIRYIFEYLSIDDSQTLWCEHCLRWFTTEINEDSYCPVCGYHRDSETSEESGK